MNDTPDQKSSETKPEPAKPLVDALTNDEVVRGKRQSRSNKIAILAVVAIFGIAVVVLVVWWFLLNPSGRAGRPVPAPRSASSEQTSTPSPAESTVTVAPEVME